MSKKLRAGGLGESVVDTAKRRRTGWFAHRVAVPRHPLRQEELNSIQGVGPGSGQSCGVVRVGHRRAAVRPDHALRSDRPPARRRHGAGRHAAGRPEPDVADRRCLSAHRRLHGLVQPPRGSAGTRCVTCAPGLAKAGCWPCSCAARDLTASATWMVCARSTSCCNTRRCCGVRAPVADGVGDLAAARLQETRSTEETFLAWKRSLAGEVIVPMLRRLIARGLVERDSLYLRLTATGHAAAQRLQAGLAPERHEQRSGLRPSSGPIPSGRTQTCAACW